MSTLPGEVVLTSPWRPRPPVAEDLVAKKPRASLPSISVATTSTIPGSAGAAVEWGDVKVHVSVAPPSQPTQHTMSHDHAVLEVEVLVAPFASLDDGNISELDLARLVREALASVVDVSAYPKSVISFRAVILSMAKSSVLPALILGATAAVEAADLRVKGRVIATAFDIDGVTSITGFELTTSRVALLHCTGIPDIGLGLSAARQIEADLVDCGALRVRT